VRALVVGSHGQLGRALCDLLGQRCAWAGDREDLDVRDAAAVGQRVREASPDVVFNATAYNAVDAAEREPGEALAVNAAAVRHLALACRETGALLVHVSTDYVFDGRKDRPYVEDDPTRPLNVYGVSKRAGELMAVATDVEHLIVRTSGVIGVGGSADKGGSFVERVLARARRGEPLRIVDDQIFSPTYAPDLAAALLHLIDLGARGLLHVTNAGHCSWHELACHALTVAGVEARATAIRTAELTLAARRPAYSVLSNARAHGLGLAPLRAWDKAVADMLRQ
jgi:dTDP-4-dehydrorhamnose reductase